MVKTQLKIKHKKIKITIIIISTQIRTNFLFFKKTIQKLSKHLAISRTMTLIKPNSNNKTKVQILIQT